MTNFQTLRQQINQIDRSILKKIKARFEVAKEIGSLKDKEKEDIEREQELFALYKDWSDELGLNVELVQEIFKKIISESKNIQNNL